MPEVDDASVVGWVICGLEVVQHALGLCQHKVPLLPLEGLSQGHTLPAAVLAYSLLQVTSLQFPYRCTHTICPVASDLPFAISCAKVVYSTGCESAACALHMGAFIPCPPVYTTDLSCISQMRNG